MSLMSGDDYTGFEQLLERAVHARAAKTARDIGFVSGFWAAGMWFGSRPRMVARWEGGWLSTTCPQTFTVEDRIISADEPGAPWSRMISATELNEWADKADEARWALLPAIERFARKEITWTCSWARSCIGDALHVRVEPLLTAEQIDAAVTSLVLDVASPMTDRVLAQASDPTATWRTARALLSTTVGQPAKTWVRKHLGLSGRVRDILATASRLRTADPSVISADFTSKGKPPPRHPTIRRALSAPDPVSWLRQDLL